MKIPVCLLIHANLQYAEIPSSEIKNIVEKSYLPTLDLLLTTPETKTAIDFSGYTLEILEENYSEVIGKIRLLIKQDSIEIMGSTFANPMLPLIPLEHAKRQIIEFQKIFNRLFGDLGIKPIGFFPQEYFFDASIVALLSEFGYKWIPIHINQIVNSLTLNLNNPLKEPFKNVEIPQDEVIKDKALYPFNIEGALGSSIVGFGSYDRITNLKLHQLHDEKINWEEYLNYVNKFFDNKNMNKPFFFLGPSDMEFIGYFSFEGHTPISPKWLQNFCLEIIKQGKFEFIIPSNYLNKYDVDKEHYLKCGGDWASLDLWTKDPDNERLSLLCQEATLAIQNAENRLEILEKLSINTLKAREVLQKAWKHLLLSENADGRGWNPIPEKRLFCYNNALQARQQAEAALIILDTAFGKNPKDSKLLKSLT